MKKRIYVDTVRGNDKNTGASRDQAKQTVAAATAEAGPGRTRIIMVSDK